MSKNSDISKYFKEKKISSKRYSIKNDSGIDSEEEKMKE